MKSNAVLFLEFLQASLSKFGQKSFAPPKIWGGKFRAYTYAPCSSTLT